MLVVEFVFNIPDHGLEQLLQRRDADGRAVGALDAHHVDPALLHPAQSVVQRHVLRQGRYRMQDVRLVLLGCVAAQQVQQMHRALQIVQVPAENRHAGIGGMHQQHGPVAQGQPHGRGEDRGARGHDMPDFHLVDAQGAVDPLLLFRQNAAFRLTLAGQAANFFRRQDQPVVMRDPHAGQAQHHFIGRVEDVEKGGEERMVGHQGPYGGHAQLLRQANAYVFGDELSEKDLG